MDSITNILFVLKLPSFGNVMYIASFFVNSHIKVHNSVNVIQCVYVCVVFRPIVFS